METLAQEPENAENADANTTEVDSGVGGAAGAESATAAAETGKTGKPPHDPDLQARFDKLTSEKYEGLSRAERAEYRAQLAEQRLADLEARQPAKTQTVAPSDDFPTLESVGYDEARFHKAVADFYTKQADQSVKTALARERETAERAKTDESWDRKEADFTKSKPDYAEKVLRPPALGGPVITDHMARVIKSLDNGPEIAYYLGENPEKSHAIARLPDYLQSAEIGTIRARLEAAKTAPPPVSKAPPPPAKLETTEASPTLDPSDPASDKLENSDEWMRRRNRQLAKLRRRN